LYERERERERERGIRERERKEREREERESEREERERREREREILLNKVGEEGKAYTVKPNTDSTLHAKYGQGGLMFQ
jgi:hypothetical protein